MGRSRRFITDDGKLLCPLCDRWVDIEGYSTRRLLGEGLDDVSDIWFEREGKNFGRPQGYCRPCMSAASQGLGAKRALQEAVRKEKEATGEVTTPEHVMSFREEMDAKARSLTPEEVAAETERLNRLYGV